MTPAGEWPDVYAPAEDSDLLARTASEHVRAGDRLLDVGAGSGHIAATLRDHADLDIVGSDINPHACRATAGRDIPVVRAHLTEPFQDDCFDLVVFNPPYLPTPTDHERDDWLERALSGGESGREVVAPFVEAVPRVLAPDGRVLLLVSTLTGIEAIERLAAGAGLESARVAETAFPFETLVVLKLVPET